MATKKTEKTAAVSAASEVTMSLEEAIAEMTRLQRRIHKLEGQGDFGLVWEDMPEAVEQLLVSEVPVLASVPSLGVKGALPKEAPHVLIEGDNLHALHTLQATHRNSVDLIYIDPPYNTGQGFIYNDKIIDRENTYRHSAWLSFMEKRLLLARDLLKDTGLIFVSIDDNEQPNLLLLCHQIFGETNFIAQLIWAGKSGGQDAKTFNRLHEYVLVFAKDASQAKIRPELSDADLSKYPLLDPKTKRYYKTQLARKWGANSLREDRPNLFYAVTAPDGTECWPLHADGTEGCWRWAASKFQKEVEAGNVEFSKSSDGKWVAYQRIWAPAKGTQVARPRSTFIPTETGTTASGSRELKAILGKQNIFDYPKPTGLLRWILAAATDEDALVLDFFAGSGTTLHAVAEHNAEFETNHRCILVTNDENGICRSVTQPRIAAVLTGKWADGKHEPLPGSLAFYKTDYITRRKSLDRMRSDIAKHTVDLVAIKEAASRTKAKDGDLAMLFGAGKSVAVVTSLYADHRALHAEADKATRDGDTKHAYLFTWSDQGIEGEVVAAWPGWEVEPLPAEMLAALRRLAPEQTLFAAEGVEVQG